MKCNINGYKVNYTIIEIGFNNVLTQYLIRSFFYSVQVHLRPFKYSAELRALHVCALAEMTSSLFSRQKP